MEQKTDDNQKQDAPASSIFPQTQRFMNAISLINKVSANKLAIVLGRILAKLHTTDEKAFTTDEEEKLCTMFKLEMSELNNVMNSSAFIFDTCAQHSLKPNRLCFELKNCGMDEKQVSAFEKAWIDHGPQFIERLKETCFAPKTLKDINWSLQMSVASQNSSQLRQPRAIFELKTGDPLQPKKEPESFFMELSLNELTNLFQDLEKIQEQLDALS